MVRLIIAVVIGAVFAVGASFVLTSVGGGTAGAKPVDKTLYNYGGR